MYTWSDMNVAKNEKMASENRELSQFGIEIKQI